MSEAVLLRAVHLPELAQKSSAGRAIEVPRYRRWLERRICHIGVGGFHRAHQARYLDRLLQAGAGEGWGICGIGLRAADSAMHHRLLSQDCLYTLLEAGADGDRLSVIGSIMDHIDASADGARAVEVLSEPATRIVSLTITEAGYCLKADGRLDLNHPDIAHDLRHPLASRSAPGLIVRALAQRHAAGGGGFTLMSCDNLIGNGHQLRAAVLGFAEAVDTALAQWIERHVSFPLSMVDRITPALDESRRAAICTAWGVEDEAPVLCEEWTQWILQDDFVAGRPRLEEVGVVLSDEVALYEDMKVSLLNGGHSALSHLGLLAGHQMVAEALDEDWIRRWLERYMNEVAQTLSPIPGIDFSQYQASLIERFRNPAIGDRLQRLAQDSSMKFRQALMPRLLKRLDAGGSIRCIGAAVALWIAYLAALQAGKLDLAAYQDVDRDGLVRRGARAMESGDPAEFLRKALEPPASAQEQLRCVVSTHLQGMRSAGAAQYLRAWLDTEAAPA